MSLGVEYKFRYTVSNDIGYASGYSPVLVTYGAKAPGQMMPPATSIFQNSVMISWTSANIIDDGGMPISAFSLIFKR